MDDATRADRMKEAHTHELVPLDVLSQEADSGYWDEHQADDHWWGDDLPSSTEVTLPPGATLQRPEPTHDLGPTFKVRTVAEALANPPQQPEQLIGGLVQRGELTVIGAPRAIGKSWLGMNLAVLGARGKGMLAGNLPVERPFRILYAQGELDEWSSYNRWRKLAQGDPPDGIIETFDRWRVKVTKQRVTQTIDGVTTTNEYLDAMLDPSLEATIAAHEIDLLIIDPWAVYYGGAENSNDEVEAALGRIRHLSMKYGLAVIIFHHVTNKVESANREPEDMWRGASRLADWASTRVTLLPHFSVKKAAELKMSRREARRHLDVHFLRRGEHTIDDFSMKMNWDSGWWERWVPPGEHERRQHSLADIASRCADDDGWDSVHAAAKALSMSDAKARDLLTAAVELGYLTEGEGARGARTFTPGSLGEMT